jgi:hypothetical protein
MWGSSSVAATVPGKIYDLGRHVHTLMDRFPYLFGQRTAQR